MCDENINQLLNILFSESSDEFNWIANNTAVPVETVAGQLRLVPDSNLSEFRRGLGMLDAGNNRIRLIINMDLFRPQASISDSMTVVFGVYAGSTLIDEFTVYLGNIQPNELIEYNLDRVYKYDGLSGNISLRIKVPEGFTNQILLDYIKSYDFNFCQDKVRSYFLLDQLVENSLASVSSAIQLLEWKIDDVETLTAEFFAEAGTSIGRNPLANWKFAKAEIDGSGRVSENVNPNSYNPFLSEWKLDFEEDEFFEGKPTGTTTGSDYGEGIMQIGIDKPEIMNGSLATKKGAFFIDIDYSKNLRIVFNVLVNNVNSNVFDSPTIYRKYFIIFNADNCSTLFYFQDQLATNPNENIYIYEDGFLSGITGVISTQTVVGCNDTFTFGGNSGVFVIQIDFGTNLGNAGISYNAQDVPDKFEIEWNGMTFSSGFVGLSTYNQALINSGVSPSEINTGNPTTGAGILIFPKTLANPNIATVRVTAPLPNTGWSIAGICPNGSILRPPVIGINVVKTTYLINEDVSIRILTIDFDGTIESYNINFGDGTSESGIGVPPLDRIKTYSSQGTKNITCTVIDNDGLTGTETIQISVFTNSTWTVSGTFLATCGVGMAGSIEVIEGAITVQNRTTITSGTIVGATITIDGIDLEDGFTTTLAVGVYPFTSTGIDCSTGSGQTELIIL